MKRITLLLLGIILAMFFLCACNTLDPSTIENSSTDSNTDQHGTNDMNDSEKAEYFEPRSKIYLSPDGSDENGDGSFENPWKTIIKARDYIRTINQGLTQDIFVYLRGGTYAIEDPITFKNEDSGINGVIIHYENYNGEIPILSGGKEITGWELFDPAKNIYMAKVDGLDSFRQLYVNGTRAVLARTPNMTEPDTLGPYYLGGKWNYLNQYETNPYPEGPYYFTINAKNIPDWDGVSPLELVTVDHWRLKMAHIASFEKRGTNSIVRLKEPEANNGIFSHGNQYINPVYTPYYFENSLSLLDTEGEWYLDHTEGIIYYKPRFSEDMNTANVIAPQTDTIFQISEEGEGVVSNLAFKGLTLAYTNWTKPDLYGYVAWTAAIGTFVNSEYCSYLPGAIELRNANHIRIEECTIFNTGANAIVAKGSGFFDPLSFLTNCVFEKNTIYDTSAGGVYLAINNDISTGNIIQNNYISHGGRQYADAVGILVSCMPNTKVLHNEICYYGYAGIHIGWDWTDRLTSAKDIEVAYNRIHDVMQLLDDAGGIYTLGNIPRCTIHDNYIYNIILSKYQGSNMTLGFNPIVAIDNDGGSNKEIYNNLIEDVKYAFSAINNPNHDNVFSNNFYNGNIGFIAAENQLVNNIFIDKVWPIGAKEIIKNSGIENNSATVVTPSPSITATEETAVPSQVNEEQTEMISEKPRIAMITDGNDIDDKSYNEFTWMGCKNWAKENGVVANYYRPSEDSNEARIGTIKSAIDEGANVIICYGYFFGGIYQQMQQQYPDVMFLGIDIGLADVPDPQPNTALITFKEEQAGFLAGYAAVMDGYAKLAFLGGMDTPAVIRYGYGFVQGVNQAATELGNTDDVSIKYWYSGAFWPTDEIMTKTTDWYTEGTQIIFSAGGSILYSAIASAEEANGKLIGVDIDQASVSDRIVTSAKRELENSVKLALSDLLANGGKWSEAFAGIENKLGAAQDGVGLPTDVASWRFSKFSIDQYAILYYKVKNGNYHVTAEIDVHPTVDIQVDYQN